jgi:hypothetical protein
MAEISRIINYTSRDFNSLKTNLIDFSKTYFPNTYNDFTSTSTGMLFIEMTAYVGDVLSFYLDNQIQETFIQYARQDENIFNLAYMLGYKPKMTTVATATIDFYQQIPAKGSSGNKTPDYDYSINIPAGTTVRSTAGNDVDFLIEDQIDFSISSSMDPTIINIYSATGTDPDFYLLKKTRKSISATLNTIQFNFSSPKKFDTRKIEGDNIIGIYDIKDTDGNTWYEVDNLAQDCVFEKIKNTNTNDPNTTQGDAANILKIKQTQKRFTTRFLNSTTLEIGFGAGTVSNNDADIVPNPNNVGTGLPFSQTKLTTAFSPLNFIFTDSYGVAPSNTTLTVRYLTGGGFSSNVPSNTLVKPNTSLITFTNPNVANTGLAQTVFDSVASNNTFAADGGQDADTLEEIRQNALGNFQNQLRTVTQQDYIIRALSMPAEFGTVAKVWTQPSKIGEHMPGELPTVLDMYILSYNSQKQLRPASVTLKNNLRTYLYEYRMINDSIKIKDAFTINIGVNFDIIVLPNFNNNEVLTTCVSELQDYFNIDKWNVNDPIFLRKLYILLDKVEGVQTCKHITINNLRGENLGYSKYAYDIASATIDDVIYPSLDPMIFEVKYPSIDIIGRVVPL